MEQPNQSGLVKSTMTYGAILGIILVIYSAILFLFKVMPVGFLIPIILLVVSTSVYYIVIYFSTRKIRDQYYGGYVTYQQALFIGTLIALFASVITAFYNYVQNGIIDPDYMSQCATAEKSWVVSFWNGKIPDTQIEKWIAQVDEKMKDYNAVSASFQSILTSTVWGFIISLVTSAFVKKKADLFEVGHSE